MYLNATTIKALLDHVNNDFDKLTGRSLKNARITMK